MNKRVKRGMLLSHSSVRVSCSTVMHKGHVLMYNGLFVRLACFVDLHTPHVGLI